MYRSVLAFMFSLGNAHRTCRTASVVKLSPDSRMHGIGTLSHLRVLLRAAHGIGALPMRGPHSVVHAAVGVVNVVDVYIPPSSVSSPVLFDENECPWPKGATFATVQ